MRQLQKMEAVGQFTGGVAHDSNNLLSVIKSSINLLKRLDNGGEERRARYFVAISDTLDCAAKVTGQLSAFPQRQALKPKCSPPAMQSYHDLPVVLNSGYSKLSGQNESYGFALIHDHTRSSNCRNPFELQHLAAAQTHTLSEVREPRRTAIRRVPPLSVRRRIDCVSHSAAWNETKDCPCLGVLLSALLHSSFEPYRRRPMKQPLTIRIDPTLLAGARECALREHRTLTNFIETVLHDRIAEAARKASLKLPSKTRTEKAKS